MARHRAAPFAFLLVTVALVGAHSRPARAQTPNWNVLVGDAVSDTLDAPIADALEAARWVLLHDHWALEPGDSASARIITRWKAVHHPLVRLVTGEARVRVAVALRAVGADRTEVVTQGGLATETNLVGNPVLNLARAAGEHESRGYVVEIRDRLADMRLARADTAGGSSTTAASQRR